MHDESKLRDKAIFFVGKSRPSNVRCLTCAQYLLRTGDDRSADVMKRAVSRETASFCEECSCKFAEHERHSKSSGRLITVGEDL